ncbi:hypothetical protein [Pyrobaculum sp.]|uniref:hypothetical protein n=1 Tax=Pyrobaculum sp. TaxID=2004705 RepID=UPI003D1450D6
MLQECRKLREKLLSEGVVMAGESKFSEMLAAAIKSRCPTLSERTLWMKYSYWADRGGVYDRCGVAVSLYDEYGERFGCLAYGLVFLADTAEAWEVLLKKGEIRVLA